MRRRAGPWLPGTSSSAHDIAAANEDGMRHTLQMKLLIFGVICVLLTVGCGIIQLLQLRTITQSSYRVAQYDVAIDDSSRLREEVIRLVARAKDVWLRGGKTDSVDAVADTAEQSWQLIDTLRARIETDLDLTPAMRDELRQYDDSMADYRTGYGQTLARFRLELAQPDAGNADTRADTALRGKGLAASGLIGGLQDELHRATAQARAGREASVATARTVTLAEVAILLVMIVSAGLWLVRTIGRGVGDVAVAAAALGSGARDVQVPIRGGGELAQLGRSFNAMVKRLDTQGQQLEELRRIAVALTRATTERAVCEIVVNGLADTFGYHYVSIYLIRPHDPDNLVLICQRGYTTVIDPIPVHGTVTGRTVRERRPVLVTDASRDTDFIAAEHQIVCEACAPILTPNRVLGTVLLEEETVGRLTETDLNLITTLANNVSVALENVRLNVEARARIDILASANRDLAAVTATGTRLAATLDRDAVYRLVAEEIARIVDAPNLYVAAYDDGSAVASLRVAFSRGEPIPCRDLPLDSSLGGWLIRTRQPVLAGTRAEVDTFLAEAGITTVDHDPQSILGVPLIVGTRVIGSVALGCPTPHAYSEQQVAVVQTIAAQAAIAINNALLYEQVQAQVAEMQRLNTELAAANALKSEFLATMSHELRTPLNAIIGFSELLADGLVSDPTEVSACLADILSSGRHLLSLINDVLDISKIEAGRMELKCVAFDLREEVAEVCRSVSPLVAARGHTLTVEAPAVPANAFADRQRIRQIILNLISNAIKFTPDSGAIRVAIAPDGDNPSLLRLSIQDTGIGIKAEDFSKLFEKFRQLDASHNRRYEGTGLGLALTKQLVELNGGEITVVSEFGQGATFAFTVPAANIQTLAPLPSEQIAVPAD
jgi:signal transduction histidine kinase